MNPITMTVALAVSGLLWAALLATLALILESAV